MNTSRSVPIAGRRAMPTLWLRSAPLRFGVITAVVLASGFAYFATPVSADPLAGATDPVEVTTSTDATATTTTIPLSISSGSANSGSTGDASSPGLFDISGHVQQAIDDWFDSLVTSAITPALQLLGRVLLSAPDLTNQADVHGVLEVTLAVADAMFGVFALVGGVTVMMHETVQSRYSVKEIAPRLVLGVITANISLLIISQAITLANALAQGLLGGVDPAVAIDGLGHAILSSANAGTFVMLLAVAATVMTVMLVCIGLIRAVLVILLIVAAPLALACHTLPQTDSFASLWWRALIACLSIQIAQALVLITAIRVLFVADGSNVLGVVGGTGMVDLLLVLCVFWVMLKIPAWAERLVFTRRPGPVNAAHNKLWVATKLAVMAA